MIETVYRRWLGFLAEYYPDDLLKPPADRITPDRVRAFIEHLTAEVRPTTVAIAANNLCYAALLIAPKATGVGGSRSSAALPLVQAPRIASTGWSRHGTYSTSASG